MSRQLPPNPNLEHLRKQAKDLLPELQARDPGARLADAQHAIAIGYGFANWPALKAHVDTAMRRAAVIRAPSPIAGPWIVRLAKPPAASAFRSAALQFVVADGTVTVTDVVVDAGGEERRGVHTLRTDGLPQASPHGYTVASRWLGRRTLEVAVTKDDRPISRITYAVSADGATLTLSSEAAAHDGYPAVEQASVFDRA